MTSVSVLGLGAMGSRLAARLVDAGHAVTIWNRSPGPADALARRGASVADSPQSAAAASDVVLSIVRDDDASRAVWDAALPGVRPGALVAEMSTLMPDRARQLAESVRAHGARIVDAPVVGTRPHAEAGTLAILAGGEAADVDALRPVAEAFAAAVHHVGPAGAGMALKLAVNALLAVQAAAVAELLAALAAEGLAPSTVAATLASMPTASPAAARLGTMMADGATALNFPVALVAKDAAYAQALSEAAGIPSHVIAATARAFAEAAGAGLGELDIAGIARFYDAD